MNFSKLSSMAFALTLICGSAQAATISTLIDFDSPAVPPGGSGYVVDGYKFTDLNVQNSTQCATGRCIQELRGQGLITTITRMDGAAFNLDGFYFSLQGNGQQATHDVSVSRGGTMFTYALGDTDADGATGGLISLYDNTNNTIGGLLGNGTIQKSTGSDGPNYVVQYDAEFDGITSVSFFGATTANTRIDNIRLSRNMPKPPTGDVPLPAAGWMLLAGLGGMAAMRRRKRA